ncbi:MAG: hypothetical protein ACRDP6_32255 [Actinoallomurus sp.]
MNASPLPSAPRLSLPEDITEEEVRALLAHLQASCPQVAIAYWSRLDLEPWLTANRSHAPSDTGYQRLTAEDWERLQDAPHWGDLDMVVYDRVEKAHMLLQALTEAGLDATT